MFSKIFLYFKKSDWILFFSVLLLLSVGLLEIYSIALSNESADLLNFKKQAFFVVAGLLVLFIFSFIDYHFIKNMALYIYFGGILFLIIVLIFGATIRGTTGWLNIGIFGIQPVEFIKIVLIVFLARFFSSVSMKVKPLKNLLISGIGSFILIGLVFLQPDFGSGSILLSIWLFTIVVVGINKKYLIIIATILVLIFSSAWVFTFEDYQKQRIITFLQPSFDPLNQGYNISQAIIAVGSGGLTGRGVGFGSQSQLKFLPEAQNDFIFAVIAEELGFLGVGLLISLFVILIYRLLANLKKIDNDFGVFFILATVGLIFVEMFINIGMNIGLLPVVGISLPFVSYGGSSIIAHLALIGIAQNIIIKSKINY